MLPWMMPLTTRGGMQELTFYLNDLVMGGKVGFEPL